jgi:hypothetical protein
MNNNLRKLKAGQPQEAFTRLLMKALLAKIVTAL